MMRIERIDKDDDKPFATMTLTKREVEMLRILLGLGVTAQLCNVMFPGWIADLNSLGLDKPFKLKDRHQIAFSYIATLK